MKFTSKTLKRALRTFFQSAVAYIAVNIADFDFSSDKSVLRSTALALAVSSLAAGISAVMNLEEKEGEELD